MDHARSVGPGEIVEQPPLGVERLGPDAAPRGLDVASGEPRQQAPERVVDLADALLAEAETLARDKAFTEEATRLKPLDILGGISFYDEVQRFETHLIKMALSETGGNQAKAARLLGIKATTLNSKIKLFNIEVG